MPASVSIALLFLLAPVLALGPAALAQSSFEQDPFASRFRERANFDIKFKLPEKGGFFRVEVPKGEGGRQSLTGEDIWEAEAPPGTLVTLTYQDLKLQARKIRADNKNKTVVAEGDIVFEQGASRLTGQRLDLDLATKIGVVTDGSLDLEGGLHLKGASIAKVGPRTFSLSEGVLTACEGEKPDWYFTMKSGHVTLEDYARLKKVTFRLGGVPLLYTPYLLWPALRDRASGFLVPGLGYSSRRGGFLGLSYYWAISRSADATVSADLYTKKYYGYGLELRGKPSEGTFGEGTYYIVWDREQRRWRWQTRGNVAANDLAPGLRAVVTWVDFSDQAFFQDYNRDFNLVSTRSVKQAAFATYAKDPLSLNLRLEREEALYGSTTVTSWRQPVLEARLRPTPLLGRRLLFEAEGQAGLLRIERPPIPSLPPTPQPSGQYDRLDIFPKLSMPLSTIPWLSLDVDLGGRLTSYGKSLSSDATTLLDERYNRAYVRGEAQLTGPSFARIFEQKLGQYDRLKHVIEPRFDYQVIPEPADLSKTPLFDEVDSIAAANVIRYALVQRLLGKRGKATAREIASLEISRLHYFRLPGQYAGGATPNIQQNSPLDATLRVNTGDTLNFDVRTTYDAHASQLTSASVTASMALKDTNAVVSLFDSHPVNGQSSAQLRYSAGTPIIQKTLRLDFQGNYDLTQGKMLESRYLVSVSASCFKVLAEYRDLRLTGEPSRDFRIALLLKNVGSFVDFTGSVAR